MLSMWGKIMIPMYRLWLHSLYGLYGPRCPLSPERPLNSITHSLTCPGIYVYLLSTGRYRCRKIGLVLQMPVHLFEDWMLSDGVTQCIFNISHVIIFKSQIVPRPSIIWYQLKAFKIIATFHTALQWKMKISSSKYQPLFFIDSRCTFHLDTTTSFFIPVHFLLTMVCT